MNSQYYRWGMIGFCRSLLWLIAILAVVGLSGRNATPLFLSGETIALTLFLAWAISFLYFAAETEYEKKWRIRKMEFRVSLIPALLTGLFFPILWLPFYCLALLLIVLGIVPVCKKWMASFRRRGMTDKKISSSLLEAEDADERIDEEIIDDSMTQQIVRRRTESGLEQVEGTFVIQFSEQELTRTLHFPFCPAFAALPKIDTFLLDGENCTINLVKPQPFGVRIDVKRSSRSSEQVRIAVIASVQSIDELSTGE